MPQISILMPAWSFNNHDELLKHIKENLNGDHGSLEFFEMNQISFEKALESTNITLKLKNPKGLMQENQRFQVQLDKAKETIKTLSDEYNKIFANSSLIKDVDQQKALKRAKKIKQLDEDNKRLRQLLRTQLENSEKLRIETQTTVETLREEFELLVKELNNFQKKNTDGNNATHHQQGYNNNNNNNNNARGAIIEDKKMNESIRTLSKLDKLEKLENLINENRMEANENIRNENF